MSVPFEQSELLARAGIRHGFFGRQGGCSTGAFASLNVSETSADDPANVRANRAAALSCLGDRLALASLTQVHSADVVTLTQGPEPASRPEADGLATRLPDIALGILTADCVPVLFADPVAGVVGACHAGWKGAVAGIVGNTIEAMEALGAERDRMIAAIGPAISGINYEVGPDFARAVLDRAPYAARRIFTPDGATRPHFDLPGFVADRLGYLGVEQVDRVGGCTYAEPQRYFSHRQATHKGTATGRQIALIAL